MSIIKSAPAFHLTDKENLNSFLSKLSAFLKDLTIALTGLTFSENFKSFETGKYTLAMGDEIGIAHNLKVVPTKKIIIYQQGNGVVGDGGSNANTSEFVYITNHGPNTVTVNLIYFK